MSEETQKKSSGRSKLLIIFASMLALMIVGVVALYMNFGSIVKIAVERVASDTLKVPVKIGSVDVDFPNKSVSVKNIRISNPEGFSKPYAMTVDTVSVEAKSFGENLFHFKNVTVGKTDLYVEVKETETNISRLNDNITVKKRADGKTEVTANTDKSDPGSEYKVIIDEFNFNEASLHPTIVLAGGDLGTVTMPDVRLTGIGKKTNGVLAKEAAAQIFDKITEVAFKTSTEQGFMQGMSPDALKNIASDMDINTSGFGKALDGMKDDFKKTGNAIKEGVKGLFGGNN